MSESGARVIGAACETATGGRGHNQDRCESRLLEPAQSLWGFRAVLVVADGMGGHEKGDQAAEIAVQAATEVLAAQLEDHTQFTGDFPGAEPDQVIRGAFERANRRIYEWAVTQDVSGDTGTTLTMIASTDEEVVVGNVGDSRAYVVSPAAVRKLSEDHSWVGQQVRLGHLTEAEADASPLRNQLTQAVGCDPAIDPHVIRMPLEADAVYVACTDGLTEVVDAEAIREVVQAGGAPEDLCRALVALAVAAGTSDNVTVAVLATAGQGRLEEAPAAEQVAETGPEEALAETSQAPPPDVPPIVECLIVEPSPADEAVAPEEMSPEVEAPEDEPPAEPDPVGGGDVSVARQRTQRLGMALIVCVVSLLLGLLVGRATVSTDAGAGAGATAGAEAGGTAGAKAGAKAGAEAGAKAGAKAGAEAGAEAGGTTGGPSGTTELATESAPNTVVVQVKCEGGKLIVTCPEELPLDVYPRGKYRDATARLQEITGGSPDTRRYQLPETPASWEGRSVTLNIERAEGGTLRITPTPDAEVFVDQKPFAGEGLSGIKPEGSRARIGFYFPSGDDAQAHAIAIVGFKVEGPG